MDSLTARFRSEVFNSYVDLLKAGYRFHPVFEHAKRIWEGKLTEQELINGPYLEKSQIYEAGDTLETLGLHEKTIATIRKRLEGRGLWRHQTDALKLLLNRENAVIATGTSSGKTLCYQIPILDDLIREPSKGLRAIIIYPLNALVNDQLDEWEKMLGEHAQITFARFTGQTPNSQEEYVGRIRSRIYEELSDKGGFTQQELEREKKRRLEEELRKDSLIPNRLNHRDAIRENPPHVLITNFPMLEYLLERPIDAPIFKKSLLKFLVLDEAHAYRGVQATEIAFLIRRLKDRLGLEKLTCIATSATLGKKGDNASTAKVRKFVSELFGGDFRDDNPIYGTPATPELSNPSFCPTPLQYRSAIETLRTNLQADIRQHFDIRLPIMQPAELLLHDENLYRLRKDILNKPKRLIDASKELWPNDEQAAEGLEALLEIVVLAKTDDTYEDLLPTRLHYFVRSQDGLHVCLHKRCPGRYDGKPAFFVSRKDNDKTPEGLCPECDLIGQVSKLVEVVTCRKCGYLYGALQDLGPRRAQNPGNENETSKPYFDSFSTELGWAADSFWSYFSVEDDLPYPLQPNGDDEEDDQEDLFLKPAKVEWCVICGKKNEKEGVAGNNCECKDKAHLRNIEIFHRQCPFTGKSKDIENLYKQEKKMLTSCPNCGARNSSGLEPVRRFQESDDETGLAMAIPLAHFNVSNSQTEGRNYRKLLCFTDHRQRAAAFPSLLEEETFVHDMGREIAKIVTESGGSLDLVSLGIKLSEIADPQSGFYDPRFFLPVSRFPDDMPSDARQKNIINKNLWIGETISYFGIPDSARESAEDLGLVAVLFQITEAQNKALYAILNKYNCSPEDSASLLQVLLSFIRKHKAFTLPSGVNPDDLAFGRVTADISYVLRREGIRNTKGWLPKLNKDGSYRNNVITDYFRRVFRLSPEETLSVTEEIWGYITSNGILIEDRKRWKLDHERILVLKPSSRYVCNRCGIVTAYSVRQACPRKECEGTLEPRPFDISKENIIARWVSGQTKFTGLKSEEHTAQINKDLAKTIEDEFRADGVNLLSSTTTFEMGINIGDLQKVLLRNAPPTSASYVQRVGRAGRGKDKNSVCVTLCRRTKYDADAWNDPPRLMSGEVRTPTVFTQNKVIAQRHFNAVVFAQYLRVKIADERVLGSKVEQKIRLEAFLALDSRMNMPQNWRKIQPPDLYLNFPEWLEQGGEAGFFQTNAGRSFLSAVSGFENGRIAAYEQYKRVLEDIAEELTELMSEYLKLSKAGQPEPAVDIKRAIEKLLDGNIIDVLAKRGFLPRYAFPLDVVTLETKTNRWSKEEDVELNRDRGIAIAEFAPGAQVIAHKKVFTSAGLYVVSKADKPERLWYSKCHNCEQIRTARTQDSLIAGCTCGRSITAQYIQPFIEPKAFSIQVDKKNENTARYRRSTLVRQRQSLTHFISSVDENDFNDFELFRVALKPDGKLFRYNKGPENRGFMLCPDCGYSAPLRSYKAGKAHKKLRILSGQSTCNKQPWTKPIAYGHQFQSFCLVSRPITAPPSVESLAFALQKGLTILLDVETSDIGVSWRWVANQSGRTGAEIILYDQTPGGAGFVQEGFENWQQVVEKAYDVCKSCKCEIACYDCLKNYGNQSHHEKLDRLVVAAFLEL